MKLYKTLMLLCFVWSFSARAEAFQFSWSARLVEESGRPQTGPLDLEVRFYHERVDGSPVGQALTFKKVPLVDGILQIELSIDRIDYDQIFTSSHTPVWIELRDTKSGKRYPRQLIEIIPFAGKVIIDEKTLAYDAEGRLALQPLAQPSSGQFLSRDGSGHPVWTTPAISVSELTIAQHKVSETPPSSGQALTFNGSQWIATDLPPPPVTGITSASLLQVSSSVTEPTVSISKAQSTAHGYVSSTDWQTLSHKQNAIGYTPVNQAGDSLSGTLELARNAIAGVGVLDFAAQGWLHLGRFDSEQEVDLIATLAPSDRGRIWINSSTQTIKYWTGSSALPLGETNAGFNSLNTESGSTHSLAVEPTGSSMEWKSNALTHTLHIPRASTVGVGGGLISHTEYEAFGSKLPRPGGELSGALNLGGHSLTTLLDPVAANDAANKGYADLKFSDHIPVSRMVHAGSGLTDGGSLSSDVSLGVAVASNANLGALRASSGKITINSEGAIVSIAANSASTVTTSGYFSGSLTGDVTGSQSATTISQIGGKTAASVAAAASLSSSAASAANNSTLVLRDTNGDFSAGIVTANVIGIATNVTGIVAQAQGGLGSNFKTTGGPGQILKQNSAGGPIVVAALSGSDLPTMIGDTGAGGEKGAVPTPQAGSSMLFLRGDGRWSSPVLPWTVSKKNSDYTVTTADLGSLLLVTSASIITLPPAATTGAGFHVVIKRLGAVTVNVVTQGGELIDGATSSYFLSSENTTARFVSDGSSWQISQAN